MNLKELKYVLYGDDRLSSKLERVNRASSKTDRSLNSASNKAKSFKNNIRGAADEIPFLNSGLRLMTNPLTIVGGLVTGIGLGLNKAKNEAMAFKAEFRELANLNLDKSKFQKLLLEANVLKSAFKFGFDPLQTSMGYYDVQSITGKYGFEVQKTVEKTGMFAKLMRADFNQTIAGSAQAMDIYNIKVQKLDDYLASLYKTVMVGKTTFNELSKVQVEYANAAASAGQDYNSANKIFAAFSKTEKSVDIAATKTKTAFEGLTKKSTIEGLKRIGVNIFDSRKKMYGVDKILEQLIPKLDKMNDYQFANLKEEIGGSEGIRGLLDLAKNKSDQLLTSFKQFDNAKFSMKDALTEAKTDLSYINDQINSKIKVSWITLGEVVLPVWISIKKTIISILDSINNRMYSITRSYYRVFDKDKYYQIGEIRMQQKLEEGFYNAKESLQTKLGKYDFGNLTDSARNKLINELQSSRDKISNKDFRRLSPLGYSEQDRADDSNILTGQKKYYDKLLYALKSKNEDSLTNLLYSSNSNTNSSGSGTSGYDANIQKGLSSISGGGTQVRNVNVTIQKLVELLKIETTNINESAEEIEQKIEQILVRAIGGAEQVLSN